MGYTRKALNRGSLDINTFPDLDLPTHPPPHPPPPPPSPDFFRFVKLLLAKKLLRLRILQNCVKLLLGFHPIFLAKLPDSPWLFGTQVAWLSLTLSRNKLQGSIIFPKSKSKEFKEIQGGNLHNFKDTLLTMYVYHKAAFTFEVNVSTSTYGARGMCFKFTHVLMNIVGSIDLHNSLQTFSIRIVWQWKTVKETLVLCTMQGK